ncbi:DUF4954 family protein [Panacibacter ginsenosidivorans]|uniref:DUF4954 family protein n=1 Tax=Panacibacter ginsenosidivorans TaxID=1813871 RepID=A0A5B8V9F6_9BACT|nr:DUF4954 family protein [Panacibacter ginsenosidivorans]QEC66988.1 DUF4954 family protein [Panacibacter ginsenosidivorans]
MAQNNIKKSSIDKLGYNFIKPEYLPKGKDEYYLREVQNRSGIEYRNLTAYEIEALVKNRNASDDWNKILVSDAFNPELVRNCKFFGLVRIGKLEPCYLEFSDMKYVVGLYNSTIISCDLGDNVVVDNVNYLSHYVIGNEVIIVNVNELITTDHAKFGIGIVKEGEPESVRIWMEICNENGGRSVIPFNDMLPADAWLWSKYRDDEKLLEQFKIFTERQFKKERGYYGKIGDRTVIKNCAIIKDVWIGSDAYIKGANKLKNLTINSGPEGISQIGEGCELVNGIIGFGCRIFYGVKAVRFVMASNSQLKYGARLINSYLGNNATISCCEVLNSLIFPAHEQHHNNSFLCAALVMGQSNIPAGATIGSNHNSRAADGEIVAGRGFWPGLCVSLKHNSKFASFTILAKADYSYELNIPIPFSLVSIDSSKDFLTVMPGYWFMYNMYALARNAWKYGDRDKRIQPIQNMEYDYLAPDTVNEMFDAMKMLELFTGRAFYKKENPDTSINNDDCSKKGKQLLKNNDAIIDELEILAEGFENHKRKTVIIKVQQSYNLFEQMITYYGALHLFNLIKENNATSFEAVKEVLPKAGSRSEWLNAGGQLLLKKDVALIRQRVKENKINSWDQLHSVYDEMATRYVTNKTAHAIAALLEIKALTAKKLSGNDIITILAELITTKEWIAAKIKESRAKDYTNPFRSMVYDSEEEMNNVVGLLSENSFIKQQQDELKKFKSMVNLTLKKFSMPSPK